MTIIEQLTEARDILGKLMDRNGIDEIHRAIQRHHCTEAGCAITRAKALLAMPMLAQAVKAQRVDPLAMPTIPSPAPAVPVDATPSSEAPALKVPGSNIRSRGSARKAKRRGTGARKAGKRGTHGTLAPSPETLPETLSHVLDTENVSE